MGITMVSVGDGKVQLMHSFYNVSCPLSPSNLDEIRNRSLCRPNPQRTPREVCSS